jgi:hypothetical protein
MRVNMTYKKPRKIKVTKVIPVPVEDKLIVELEVEGAEQIPAEQLPVEHIIVPEIKPEPHRTWKEWLASLFK